MSGEEPRTVDEWRRALELADAKLAGFDRRMAARTDLPNPDDWRGIAAAWAAAQRKVEYDDPREALVNAAEDARLGLLRATQAAEAEGPTPTEARGLTDRQIRAAALAVRARIDRAPTREQVAKELNTSEPTLKRAMKDLRMGVWPPAPPEEGPDPA